MLACRIHDIIYFSHILLYFQSLLKAEHIVIATGMRPRFPDVSLRGLW